MRGYKSSSLFAYNLEFVKKFYEKFKYLIFGLNKISLFLDELWFVSEDVAKDIMREKRMTNVFELSLQDISFLPKMKFLDFFDKNIETHGIFVYKIVNALLDHGFKPEVWIRNVDNDSIGLYVIHDGKEEKFYVDMLENNIINVLQWQTGKRTMEKIENYDLPDSADCILMYNKDTSDEIRAYSDKVKIYK